MTKHRPRSLPDVLDWMMQPVETKVWTADSAASPSETEQRRLQQLHQLGVLDTPRERLFDTFVEQALKIVPGTTIAAVSLVDADRQWFKSVIGMDLSETPRTQSFCSHVIQTRGVLVVNDATKDARFADNPLVTGAPGIRFYAGIKLTRAVGALCVIGTKPRDITTAQLGRLHQLAQFVDIQLLAGGPPRAVSAQIANQPDRPVSAPLQISLR